jgi:REP element-mobilizing transposase RayT
MLHDSFPITRRREWEGILNEPDDSHRRRKLEAWLDRGHGECWLRRVNVASLVEEKLRENDGKSYRLQAWTIMPNHVHLVVDVWELPLSKLLHQWKGASARAANLVLKRRGHFWEREYFDTLIRDAAHLDRAIRYTEANPLKARLTPERKAWRWSSARLRDEYEHLSWRGEAAA